MLETAQRTPELCRVGLQAGAAFEPPDGWRRPRCTIVAGMGGSAIGGTIAAAALAAELTAPLEVIRAYDLPGGVDEATLVCAISYSGNTEETLSVCRAALARGARIVAICSGGELAKVARAAEAPVVTVPSGLPPRAAMGYLLFALLEVLRRVEAIAVPRSLFERSVEHLVQVEARVDPDRPTPENVAKRIAADLLDHFPIIYGGSPAHGAAAYRWRTQLNENAKVLVSHHQLPELNHNEVVGWDLPKAVAKQTVVVLLRSATESARLRVRADFTADLVRARVAAFHEVQCSGEHPLQQVLEAILIGDFVSLYLAALRQIDPYPVPTIDALKRTLAQAG